MWITLPGQTEMGTRGGVDVNMMVMSSFAVCSAGEWPYPIWCSLPGAAVAIIFVTTKRNYVENFAFCLADIEHDSFLDGILISTAT